MKKVIIMMLPCIVMLSCNSGEEAKTLSSGSDSGDSSKAEQQAEFADPKFVELGKASFAKFAAEDVDGWAASLSDNIVYLWSGGDSLVGKKAVVDYWKARFANVVDSVSVANDIWLPIKVNKPQQGPDMVGNWLLSWHQVTAKYKSGKSITFWVHTDYHFDSNDKVDRYITYMDMAKIQAAASGK